VFSKSAFTPSFTDPANSSLDSSTYPATIEVGFNVSQYPGVTFTVPVSAANALTDGTTTYPPSAFVSTAGDSIINVGADGINGALYIKAAKQLVLGPGNDIEISVQPEYSGPQTFQIKSKYANQDFDIRPYIEKHELILTHDINGINAGTYIAKSTNLVKQFFHAVKSHGPLFFNHHPWKDQEAMRYFLQTYPYHEIATWMPQNFMNSNIHEIYNYPSYVAGNYKEGDWIVHMSGMSHENRMRVLKDKFKLTQGELFPLNPNMFESKVVNIKNEL
jgi:hypothetical protein